MARRAADHSTVSDACRRPHVNAAMGRIVRRVNALRPNSSCCWAIMSAGAAATFERTPAKEEISAASQLSRRCRHAVRSAVIA